MDVSRYLARIGLDPGETYPHTLETVERLQAAHVRTVPFETLSITGDPHGRRDGRGVSLETHDLYEKIVERGRGGFCYELNGLFGWLLGELGFDATRVAARVVTGGAPTPPANHLSHVVALDRRYVVDVGLGIPTLRRPLPLDGGARADAAGVEWRADTSDRPDADYVVRFREPDTGWTDRYVFRDVPRGMAYFEATCEYLATAPKSPFTGEPVVTIATETGHAKLTPTTFSEGAGGETEERPLEADAWYDVAEREFGLRYGVGRSWVASASSSDIPHCRRAIARQRHDLPAVRSVGDGRPPGGLTVRRAASRPSRFPLPTRTVIGP